MADSPKKRNRQEESAISKSPFYTARSIEVIPRGGPSLNGGSASRIHQHTAPKRGSTSRIHQHTAPQKGSASKFHQPKGGPPLDFINQKGIPSTKKGVRL